MAKLRKKSPAKGAGTRKKTATRAAVSAESLSGEDREALHIVVMDSFDQNARVGEDADTAATLPQGEAKYARIFATYGGARVTESMRLRKDGDEPPTEFGKIIRLHERIKKYTNRDEGTLPEEKELIQLGDSLFKTLFPPKVRRLYDIARSRQRDGLLDLVFTSMVPWIAEKPWEFAYDAELKRFVATRDVNFVRNVLTSVPSDIPAPNSECLRILVVAAQPVGFVELSIRQETQVIRRGFQELEKQGLAKVDVIARASPESLQKALSTGKYSVVHFIGHGVFDEKTQEGALIFESVSGKPHPLTGKKLRDIFCDRGLSLIFLNACLSGTGGRADFNKGVAQSLVEQGLPALVANQYSVLDSSATAFAKHFYWSLAHGLSLGRAAREARIFVNCSLNGEIIDWAVPVVYARDPNMVLCAARPGRGTAAAEEAGEGVRRSAMRRKYTIGVWDSDRSLPGLATTLDTMNDAQKVFGFELVDMSMPLDVWDIESRSPDGSSYLWAEKLAKRIDRKTTDMRIDLFTCITRHWLRDDTTFNLYGWWGDSTNPPVGIFSYAGFPLPPEGATTDRVLVNAMVTALAGNFGDMESHEEGSKQCPLYYNRERNFDLLSNTQQFESGCAARLRKTLKGEYAALEKLLLAFN